MGRSAGIRPTPPHSSIVRLDIHPRAIIGDRRRRRAVVHVVARAEKLRRCGDIGVEHDLHHRPADLLDHSDANLAAVWGGEEGKVLISTES